MISAFLPEGLRKSFASLMSRPLLPEAPFCQTRTPAPGRPRIARALANENRAAWRVVSPGAAGAPTAFRRFRPRNLLDRRSRSRPRCTERGPAAEPRAPDAENSPARPAGWRHAPFSKTAPRLPMSRKHKASCAISSALSGSRRPSSRNPTPLVGKEAAGGNDWDVGAFRRVENK